MTAREPAEYGMPADAQPEARYRRANRDRGFTAFEARHAAVEAMWRDRLGEKERAVLAAHYAGDLVLGGGHG